MKPKGNSKGYQVRVMGYYPRELAAQLAALSESTRIPKTALLREALSDLLKMHATTLRRAATWPPPKAEARTAAHLRAPREGTAKGVLVPRPKGEAT